MARRANTENDNYWPGYVDALSTIVMVVTFLLIILAIIIMILSKTVADNLLSRGREAGGLSDDVTRKQFLEHPTEASDTPPVISETYRANASPAPTQSEHAPQGWFDVPFDRELTQDDPVDRDNDLAATSREMTQEDFHIVIAKDEAAREETGVRVTASASVITLEFPGDTARIDDPSREKIRAFLSRTDIDPDARFEIRAFATARDGSVSGARRLAFYRSMAARNNLLEEGIESGRIQLIIHETGLETESRLVRILLKP